MTITYLKKADKTPQTGTDETQAIVHEMLARIEVEGEDAVRAYAEKLDAFTGDVIVSQDQIAAAADKVSDQLKADIQFSYDRVTKFAEAQKQSISEFETGIITWPLGRPKRFPSKQRAVMCLAGAMRMLLRRLCLWLQLRWRV